MRPGTIELRIGRGSFLEALKPRGSDLASLPIHRHTQKGSSSLPVPKHTRSLAVPRVCRVSKLFSVEH
jgi:hypothetical protein